MILVIYIDRILLVANDVSLIHDIKNYLSQNFKIKDIGEISYVIGIKIFRNRSQGLLRLSQKTHIDKF